MEYHDWANKPQIQQSFDYSLSSGDFLSRHISLPLLRMRIVQMLLDGRDGYPHQCGDLYFVLIGEKKLFLVLTEIMALQWNNPIEKKLAACL